MASSANPYENYESPSVEPDLIDPDDGAVAVDPNSAPLTVQQTLTTSMTRSLARAARRSGRPSLATSSRSRRRRP